MYCKTFRTKLSGEGMEKFTRFVEEKYKPLISRQKGFRGVYFCTKEDNEFVMIMLWEEKENIQAWSDNQDHKTISADITSLFINEIYQDIYKVTDSA